VDFFFGFLVSQIGLLAITSYPYFS
jgi:hypothetical protein